MRKLNEEIKKIKKIMGINENLTPNLLYHGTIYDFDSFQSANIGTGMGKDLHGYGIYFTDNKEIAEFYTSQFPGNKSKFVYTVKLRTSGDFLEWETPIEEYQAHQIYKLFERQYPHENMDDLSDALGLSENYYGEHPLTFSIYDYLSVILGGKQKASELLSDCGIDGIRFNSKENGFDSTNYVIFDTGNVRIVDKEQLF